MHGCQFDRFLSYLSILLRRAQTARHRSVIPEPFHLKHSPYLQARQYGPNSAAHHELDQVRERNACFTLRVMSLIPEVRPFLRM